MSFVVTVSTSTVSYALPTGATNAFAGQTIASATWNNIHTDVENNGLAVVGGSNGLTLKGNSSGSVAVVADVSIASIQNMLAAGQTTVKVVVSFSNASTDTILNLGLPSGFTNYQVAGLFLSAPTGSLSTATVSLYTGAGATGVAVVGPSAAVTVVTSTAGANNNLQSFTINNQSTESYAANPIYFRVGGSTASAQGTVTLFIRALS